MTAESSGPLSSPELSVKLFIEDPSGVDRKELIPVFHRWIKEGLLEDELMIDVATYEHVPKGPSLVLICDTAHYYFDDRAGRTGLRFRGRRQSPVGGEQGIDRAFRSALLAASLLENDPALDGRYRFGTGEFEFGIYDRLRAPSDQATFDAVRPELERYIGALYGGASATLELASGPREPFMVTVATGASPSVDELLGQAAASP